MVVAAIAFIAALAIFTLASVGYLRRRSVQRTKHEELGYRYYDGRWYRP